MNAPSSILESAPVVWGMPKRLAFRFGIIAAVLLLFPFPLYVIPKIDFLTDALGKPMEWLVDWFTTAVLGLDQPSHEPTGSGDTTAAYVFHLIVAIMAVVGTAVWSVLDRRRHAYPRLAALAFVVLRYYLGYILLSYAFAKFTQFPPPGPGRLDQRVGEMSPMGMLWTFMGSSQPYSLFGGFMEALGGALLLWRRTAIAGALVAIATMTNVVALNFCYDVPVKLFSTQLLFIAILITLPHARRLLAAVLGHATAEVPQPPRHSKRWERARLIAHWSFIALLLVGEYFDFEERHSSRFPPKHELHGVWLVEQFTLDGNKQAPDAERWRKLVFGRRDAYVRTMTDAQDAFLTKIDPIEHTIKLRKPEAGKKVEDGWWRDTKPEDTWRYTKSADAEPTLVIDGMHNGKRIRVKLKREADPLLVTRGFHWINEVPFNR